MLQVMQYTTSVFLVVEICLLIHATVLIFKANQEHPINQEKFRTYSEYKAIRESYRKEKEMRRHTNATFISSTAGGGHFEELIENNELETNYDENVIAENDHGWDTGKRLLNVQSNSALNQNVLNINIKIDSDCSRRICL